ncbi:pilus assembly protein CpaD [Sphingomonas sp. F9_3S_D5_B_2]
MRIRIATLVLASIATGGCGYTPHDLADRGVESVNQPVVTAADYVFDAAAPGGTLAPGEPERLNSWFQGLGLGYGDSIYVDGADAYVAREQVAAVAGNYGMMVQAGAPVTAGMVQPGAVRVVVSRRRAIVANCPNWSRPSSPDFNNRSLSNFGCGVNSDLAMMVANPEDLVHGQEGTGVADAMTGAKAVQLYRSTPPTGSKGLLDVNTKGSK